MKKFILIVIGLLLWVVSSVSQTYHYNQTQTFKEKKYTYQCDFNDSTKMVTLYNAENEMTYIDLMNEERKKLYLRSADNPDEYVESVWNEPKYNFFVRNVFTPREKRRLKGYKLGIIMCIDTKTGETVEVNFNFLCDEPFASIPLAQYRRLEKAIKSMKSQKNKRSSEIKDIPDYIILYWRQEID